MGKSLPGPRKRPEKADVERAIRETGGKLSAAAIRLGCSRQTLYTWVYQYQLDRVAGIVTREHALAREAKAQASGAPQPLAVKLPAELHKWIRIQAIKTNGSASSVVEEAVGLLRAVVEEAGRS